MRSVSILASASRSSWTRAGGCQTRGSKAHINTGQNASKALATFSKRQMSGRRPSAESKMGAHTSIRQRRCERRSRNGMYRFCPTPMSLLRASSSVLSRISSLFSIHFDLLEPVNTAAHVSFIWWLRPPPSSPKAYER